MDLWEFYLQQYLYRGTPKVLPEEDRYKLSIKLNLDTNEFTPEWLQNKNDDGNDQNIFIPNISNNSNSDLKKIYFSKALLEGINLTQIQNIFFYQTSLDTNTVVTNLVDVSTVDAWLGLHTKKDLLSTQQIFHLLKRVDFPIKKF